MLIVLRLNPESEATYNERYLEKSSSEGHVSAPLVGLEDSEGRAGARTNRR